MSKHTPGPWFINDHPYDNQPEYILAKTGDSKDDCRDIVNIAIVERNKNVIEGWRSKEEAIANARLIAAAPEMLEALKTVVRYAQKSGDTSLAIGRAMNAIAKAEGK